MRMPSWAHIQRSIDDRQRALFNQRYNNGPGPKTASMRLPNYTPTAPVAASGERPQTAPAR